MFFLLPDLAVGFTSVCCNVFMVLIRASFLQLHELAQVAWAIKCCRCSSVLPVVRLRWRGGGQDPFPPVSPHFSLSFGLPDCQIESTYSHTHSLTTTDPHSLCLTELNLSSLTPPTSCCDTSLCECMFVLVLYVCKTENEGQG